MRNSEKIILFADSVDWVTPTNIAILLYGENNAVTMNRAKAQLHSMAKAKKPSLKKLPCKSGAAFALKGSKRKYVGDFKFNHDTKLRNVLAKYGWKDGLTVKGNHNADAQVGDLYFEMDNGYMDRKQLIEKMMIHYSKREKLQVLFIMCHKHDISELEQKRLDMLFSVSKEVFPYKPNRVLGCCYTDFLRNGKVFNRKGVEV
jgi:hypothetical protein